MPLYYYGPSEIPPPPANCTTPDGANGLLTQLNSNSFKETRQTEESYYYTRNPSINSANYILTRIQNAAGSTWTLNHDSSWHLQSASDPQNRLCTFTRKPVSGLYQKIIDPFNRITTTIFESIFDGVHLINVINHVEYPDSRRITFTYLTQEYEVVRPTLNQIIYPNLGRFTNYYYFNGFLNTFLYRVISPLSARTTYLWEFNGGLPYTLAVTDPNKNRTTYTFFGTDITTGPYDIRVLDPLTNITTILKDGARPGTIIDPLGNRATISYLTMTNTLNDRRMNTVTLPSGGIFTFGYNIDDRVTLLFDENGNRSTLIWDDNGNRIGVVDVLGQRTSYTYTLLNQVQSEINPLLEITSFIYNSFGQVIAQINPLGHRTTNTYSSYGQLIRQQDPLNRITSMQYDIMNRITLLTDPNGGETQYFYDVNGTDLQSVINPAAERSTYLYDLAGQLSQFIDPMNGRMTYSYDPAGNLISLANQNNEMTTYRYDGCNRRISSITPLGFRTSYAYNAGSYLTSTQNPDLTTTGVRYTVDEGFWPPSMETAIEHPTRTTSSATGRP